jgi:hypothetical protein
MTGPQTRGLQEHTKVTSGDRIALPTLLSDEMVREFGYL